MGLMDALRKGVADVAAEAEKAARVGRLSTEMSGFHNERRKTLQEIGQRVAEVYAGGGRTDPDFSTEWERIQELDAEIAKREAEIAATKSSEET
jgi:hypothetical protein